MKIRYKYTDKDITGQNVSIVVSREDVYRVVGNREKTTLENEQLIDEYLSEKKAIRVYDGSFNEYQLDTRALSSYPKDTAIGYLMTGLSAQSGQLLTHYRDLLKSNISINFKTFQLEQRRDLLDSLGDMLWHISRLADEMGVSLSEIAEKNIGKISVKDSVKNAKTEDN